MITYFTLILHKYLILNNTVNTLNNGSIVKIQFFKCLENNETKEYKHC